MTPADSARDRPGSDKGETRLLPSSPVHAGGRCRRAGALARVAAAEALGAALLVLAAAAPPPHAALPAPLLAGLVVAALVQCFGGISGAQLNPVVSAAAWLRGRMDARRALAEVLAQLAGACAGAAALGPAALVRPDPRCGAPAALAAEALGGAVLALANLAQWEGGAADTWPLRAGAVVAALTAAAAPLSGAGLNPARALGPALRHNSWEHHWVYWVGPLGGGVAAVLLHAALWRPRATAPRETTAPPPSG